MSNDINFAPGSHARRKHADRDGIEYTSGEMESVPERQPQPTPPSQQSAPQQPTVEPATPKQEKPKKTHSFFAWRKNRHDDVPETTIPAAVPTHDAPQHHKETTVTDLLHGTTGVTPAPLRQPAKPQTQNQPARQQQTQHQPVAAIKPQTHAAAQVARATAPVVSPTPTQKTAMRKPELADTLPVTEVNLIPDAVLDEFSKRNRLRDVGYVAVLMVVLVLLAYGGFKIYERKITSDTVAVETDIQTLNEKIAQYKDIQLQAQDVSDRLAALSAVMQSHIYWTPFLERIESLTLPTVYYTTMTGSASSGTFTFDAVAQSYDQIAPQVAVLRHSPLVSDISVSSIQLFQPSTVISSSTTTTGASEGVSFKLTVQFTSDTFIHSRLQSYVQD